MKIYYNSKDKSYIPALWCNEIKGKNLVYFVQGKGYIKTNLKYIQEMEVEIKKPENYTESWLIYSKYGKEILKQVITNNADYWKDSYCRLVSAGEKACKLFDQFAIYFNKDILKFIDPRLFCFGLFSFDIIAFDTYISNQFDYNVNKLVSLQEFIRITFGNDQVKCIENLINLYDYIKE